MSDHVVVELVNPCVILNSLTSNDPVSKDRKIFSSFPTVI